jgi:hypothetical protein
MSIARKVGNERSAIICTLITEKIFFRERSLVEISYALLSEMKMVVIHV